MIWLKLIRLAGSRILPTTGATLLPGATDEPGMGTFGSLVENTLLFREVPTNLHSDLEPALEAHIKWLQETKPRGWDGRRLFPAKAYSREDGSTNVGTYITPNNFYRAVWNRACAELGIKGLTFHAARHTFATKCLHAGATPQEIAGWLGDTLEVTLRHYSHVIEGLRKERAGLLGEQATAAPKGGPGMVS